MKPNWTFWSFCPGFGACISWLHAGVRTRHLRYFGFAAIYSVFIISLEAGPSVAESYGEDSFLYNLVTCITVFGWIAGIIHTQAMKRQVNLRILAANQPKTDDESECFCTRCRARIRVRDASCYSCGAQRNQSQTNAQPAAIAAPQMVAQPANPDPPNLDLLEVTSGDVADRNPAVSFTGKNQWVSMSQPVGKSFLGKLESFVDRLNRLDPTVRRKTVEESIVVSGNRDEILTRCEKALSSQGFSGVMSNHDLYQVKGKLHKFTLWGEILLKLQPDGDKTTILVSVTCIIGLLNMSSSEKMLDAFKAGLLSTETYTEERNREKEFDTPKPRLPYATSGDDPVPTTPAASMGSTADMANTYRVWYCKIGGANYGPFSSEELRILAQHQRFSPIDLLWRDGLAEWTVVTKVEGLFSGIAAPTAIGTSDGRATIADILEMRIQATGGIPPALSKQVFLAQGMDADTINGLRNTLGLVPDVPIVIGFNLRFLGNLVNCAALTGDALAVFRASPPQREYYDLRKLKWSVSGFARLVHLEAEGHRSLDLSPWAKPFIEWLTLLVRECLPATPIGPPWKSEVAPLAPSVRVPAAAGSAKHEVAVPVGNQTSSQPPSFDRPQIIDINSAPEEMIAALPGVGPILAKKALEIRKSNRGFDSLESFADALGLKPHNVERLRALVVVVRVPQPEPLLKGRIVDF